MTRHHGSKAATLAHPTPEGRQQPIRGSSEARKLARKARRSASGAIDALEERGDEMLEKGRDALAGAANGFEPYVSKNPFKAVVIAASVGALLGFALRRRS